MQLACIEFARNVAGLKKANTTEIDSKTPYPIIHIMPEQEKKLLKKEYGATMRLGAWDCKLKPGTKTHSVYKQAGRIHKDGVTISERHRHRFEFNNLYRDGLEKLGLTISGTSPDGTLVETIELAKHPYFVASQFHPEFTSRPFDPHPLFVGFIKAIK
jgi:CTP synthase